LPTITAPALSSRCHNRGVVGRNELIEDLRGRRRAHPAHAHVVLERDRDASQRTEPFAGRALAVDGGGAFQRAIGSDVIERVERAVHRRHAIQRATRQASTAEMLPAAMS
jgi:hypothetical protein